MNYVSRHFGMLFFLALVGGLAVGLMMAQRGMQVDLGAIGGVKLVLAAPAKTATRVVAPGLSTGATTPGAAAQSASPSTTPAAGQAFGLGTTGTVQSVNGNTITLTTQNGSPAKATVSDSTTYVKNATITVADIKVGDTVTVIGAAAADGSVSAQQVTVGAVTQAFGGAAALGGAGRQGAAGGQGGAASQAGAAALSGSVQKAEGNTLTVAVTGGQPTKVLVSADTRLRKTETATLADVSAGSQVTITGQTGSDGSITALAVLVGSLR